MTHEPLTHWIDILLLRIELCPSDADVLADLARRDIEGFKHLNLIDEAEASRLLQQITSQGAAA